MPTLRFKHDVNAQETVHARKVDPGERTLKKPVEAAPPKPPPPKEEPIVVQPAKPVIPEEQPAIPAKQKKIGLFARIGSVFGGPKSEPSNELPSPAHSGEQPAVNPGQSEATSPPAEPGGDAVLADLDALLAERETPPATDTVSAIPPQETASQPGGEADDVLADLDTLLTDAETHEDTGDVEKVPESNLQQPMNDPTVSTQSPAGTSSSPDDADTLLADLDALLDDTQDATEPGPKPEGVAGRVDESSQINDIAEAGGAASPLGDLEQLLKRDKPVDGGTHDPEKPGTQQ